MIRELKKASGEDYSTKLKDRLIMLSFYTACAASISLAESLIPKPFPFLKLGLANIVLLLLLMKREYVTAILVLVGKVILSGLFLATILMPTTLIALVSGITSLSFMILANKLKIGFSWVGISIVGAVVHNLMQLVIVRTTMIYSNSVFDLIPLLILLGLVTGTITGILAIKLNQNLTWSFHDKKI